MISCIMRLSTLGDRRRGLEPTRRILVDDLPEFIITHCWEVITVDVLLELRIRTGVVGTQEELPHAQRSTHVTLRLCKAKRVPSSSQLPEVASSVGQRETQNFGIFATCDERNLGDAALQYQLLRRGFKERPIRPRDPGNVR